MLSLTEMIIKLDSYFIKFLILSNLLQKLNRIIVHNLKLLGNNNMQISKIGVKLHGEYEKRIRSSLRQRNLKL